MMYGYDNKSKSKGFINSLIYALGISVFIHLALQFFLFDSGGFYFISRETLIEMFPLSEGYEKFPIVEMAYSLLLWNGALLNALIMFPFFFTILYMGYLKHLELRKKGKLLRGVELIKNSKLFIKLITLQAKENVKKLEQDLKKKLPNFYTPRIFLTNLLIPFFKDFETKGILVIGGAGSGKTNAIWDYIMKQIKWMQDNNKYFFMAIYDRKHDFWKKLYRTFSYTLKNEEAQNFDFSDFNNGFSTVSLKIYDKKETVSLVYEKDKLDIAMAEKIIKRYENSTHLFRMRIDKDGLFFPNDIKTIRWNKFDEFIVISLVVRENGKVVDRIKCPTIKEAKRIFTEKDVPNFKKDETTIEIEKELLAGEYQNFLFAIKPPVDDEVSEGWNTKGRKGLDAIYVTVAYTYDFPSDADFINFCNKYDTREKLVAKIAELGYAKTYRSISITSLFGEVEKPSEASVNTFESAMSTITSLKKPAYYYYAEECDFSIRALVPYLEKDYFDYRLFMVQDPKNETEYSLVFTAIYELLGKEIIQLSGSYERRLFLFLDEVASLGKITTIVRDLPQQARAKGAAVLFGLQSLADWAETFSDKKLQAIIANVKTRLYLSIEDDFTLDIVLKNISEAELEIESESMNEKNEGSSSLSIQKREVIARNEISGLGVSEGFLKQGKYIHKIYFPIPQIEEIAKYEENTSMIKIIPVEFDAELESEHFTKRAKVSEAITFIQNNTNKNLTPESIVFYSKIDLQTVQKIIKEFIEEKDQIERAVLELMKQGIYGDSPKPVYIKALKNKTGLKHIEEVFITKTFLKSKAPKKQEPKIEEPKPKIEEPKKEPEAPKKAPESPFDEDDFEPEELSADDLDSLLQGMQ